jgi:hypothetical protein
MEMEENEWETVDSCCTFWSLDKLYLKDLCIWVTPVGENNIYV